MSPWSTQPSPFPRPAHRHRVRPMDLGLKDRVYVVTGATRGLGHATARELVADGARVVISGRDGASVAEAVKALGPGAVGVTADNADPAAADRLIATAR